MQPENYMIEVCIAYYIQPCLSRAEVFGRDFWEEIK